MTNLILTPVYRAYDRVAEMCEAIDKHAVNPYLHVLVDDNSDCGEFPVKPTKYRRILLMKRDYTGIIHKNGLAQAVQLAYDWAIQAFFNEKPNPVFDNVFLIESDVIVREQWDQKMLDLVPTLPSDWLTLDQQSVDTEGKLTTPTTISPREGYENADLEIMKYPDFQVTLFNKKIFEAGIKFSDFPSHFDIMYGNRTKEVLNGRHFRTKLVSSLHYGYSSRQHLNEIPKQ